MIPKDTKINALKEMITNGTVSIDKALVFLDEHIRERQASNVRVANGARALFKDLTGFNPRRGKPRAFNAERLRRSFTLCTFEQLINCTFINRSPETWDVIMDVLNDKLSERYDLIPIRAKNGNTMQTLIDTKDPEIIRWGIRKLQSFIVELEEALKQYE